MTKCGYVALIGAPNAGKSTMLNALIGNKVSIVTAKPQTTRNRIRGIAIEGDAQIIFVDTPGIFEAKPKFEKAMVEAAWSGSEESDISVLVVDANRGLDDDTRAIAENIKAKGRKAILVLNKVDKTEKTMLPELAAKLYQIYDFERSFMISATRGNGVKDVLLYLASQMPESPFLYPEDEITDSTERNIAEEITREQCFTKLHAELPYGLMVETEKWQEENKKGKRVIKINQLIVIEREAHKKIILGKNGAMLKSIGSNARHRIGEALDAEVNLFLFIKVNDNWKSDPAVFKATGLEYK
ncbi:MAG: GTPase Era, partial [Pseudomonadota bacterium]